MDADRQKIIERVWGLQAKTVERGATPEEAETAQNKAKELIEKHKLTAEELEHPSSRPVDPLEAFRHRINTMGKPQSAAELIGQALSVAAVGAADYFENEVMKKHREPKLSDLGAAAASELMRHFGIGVKKGDSSE